MWEQYRKTVVVIQSFILIFCLVLYFVLKLPLAPVLVFFGIMQFGAVWGAWWARASNKR